MKIVFSILITLTLFFSSGFRILATEGVSVRVEGNNETIFKGEVELINSCSINPNNSEEEQVEGPMAICALNQAANVGGFSLEFQDHSIGLFLKKVAEVDGDWRYWVNKQYGPVGLDSFSLKSGDSLVLSVDNPDFPEETIDNPVTKQKLKETKIENKISSTQVKEPENQNPVVPKEKKEEIETISAPKEQEVKKPEERKKIVTKSENALQLPSQEKTLQATNIKPQPASIETKSSSNPSPSPLSSPSPSPNQEQRGGVGNQTVKQETSQQGKKNGEKEDSLSYHSHNEPSTTETLAKATPQQSSLPQTGPEIFLLGIGGGSLAGGSFLRLLTRREDPFARLLKRVKADKKWYYH